MVNVVRVLKEQFMGDHYFFHYGKKKGYALRFSDQTLCVADSSGATVLWKFAQIADARLIPTYVTNSKMSGGLSIGRAIVGGVMLGGVGAVVGGVTGSRRTVGSEHLTSLTLQLSLRRDGGLATEALVLHCQDVAVCSEATDRYAHQIGVQAEAAFKEAIRLGEILPAAPSPSVPPPPSHAELFEDSVEATLHMLGWRTKRVMGSVILGVKGDVKGVFMCAPEVSRENLSLWKFDPYPQARVRMVIAHTSLLAARRQAEAAGVKLVELRDLRRRAEEQQAGKQGDAFAF